MDASVTSTLQRLPGGVVAHERWLSPTEVIVSVRGDARPSDRWSVLDLLTAHILEGARRVVVDRGSADAVGETTLRRVASHLARSGGSLVVLPAATAENLGVEAPST